MMQMNPHVVNKLNAFGEKFAELFVGATYAHRIQRDDGKWIYVPVGRKRGDGSRELVPLTGKALVWHFLDKQPSGEDQVAPCRIGVYPMVEQSNCYFVAVDVDNHEGNGNVRNLVEQLGAVVPTGRRYGIQSFVEISGGGGGCHIWIFFRDQVEAKKARRLLFRLICAAGLEEKVLDGFDGHGNFDRLFPTQDVLKPKQLGNLIALPYNGFTRWKSGRSVIVDLGETGKLPPDGSLPIVKPGDFVNSVRRHSSDEVDAALLKLLVDGYVQDPPGPTDRKSRSQTKAKARPERQGRPKKRSANRRPRPSTVNWERFLEDNNIEYEVVSEASAVLGDCPYCGDLQKAWVNLNTGWLNCWHATCPANYEKGVSPSKWCKKLGLKRPHERKG